jgi:hypothetical protein
MPNVCSRSPLRRRHSVRGKETDTVSGRERVCRKETEINGYGVEKPNAFSRKKPATKPLFSLKRKGIGKGVAMPNAFGRSLLQSRKKKRRGSCEAERIQSKECSEAAIQSVAKSLQC